MRKIIDAADIREKALTLVFVSSGIREGAIEHLRVGNYPNIQIDREKTAAGRLVVYSGDPEQYTAFITPEACDALDKYLDFRRANNQGLSAVSGVAKLTLMNLLYQ